MLPHPKFISQRQSEPILLLQSLLHHLNNPHSHPLEALMPRSCPLHTPQPLPHHTQVIPMCY
jgi:hypothetical protein